MDRLTARNENGEAYYKRCYESPCDGTGEACDNCNFIDEVLCERLAAFEDNGITPEQMREISDEYRKLCEEFAEYRKMDKLLTKQYGCNMNLVEFTQSWIECMRARERGNEEYRFCVLSNEDYDEWKEYKQLKEQERLVELPCKVGDTVYVKLASYCNLPYAEAEVRDFTYFTSCGFCAVVTSKHFDKHSIPFTEFGKTVFLTREEAEQALKQMGGVGNGMD